MSTSDGRRLDASIEALLADEAYQGHPLRQALADLYEQFQAQLYRIEKVARISDSYQSAAREAKLSLSERYARQVRQIEKVARISDRYQLMLQELNATLKEASTTDALTGLGNRRMLMERLRLEASRQTRLRRPFSVAIADIDHFKAVNDTYGHEAGDKVLAEIAQTIRSCMREYDACGRWGGEEFMIIMPEAGAAEAVQIIERLRHAIETANVLIGEQRVELSASFGIAQHSLEEPVFATVHRADAALYAAKQEGRNRHRLAG
ncbi:MAG: biofilm regulation diguanylate cyclase SiaD [Noviherbaspirillum sp.]